MINQTSEPFPKYYILVVDDEIAILMLLRHHLIALGYEVKTAVDGLQALETIEDNLPDLIILDLMMPNMDGLAVTQHIRTQLRSAVPIIILSARGEEQKKVEALDAGADDYLTKPFGVDELLARVRVALRHTQPFKLPVQQESEDVLIGNSNLNINFSKHQVQCEGKELKLTPKQYELLKYMALNEGKLLSHRMLLKNIWGREYGTETQYLHVYIGQLRQKLELNPAKPQYIITEPGLGYRFHLPDPKEDF